MDARHDAHDPGRRDSFGTLSLGELWQLTNRPQPVYAPAVRAACLALLVFYAITAVVRHMPGQPLVLGLRAAVLAYALMLKLKEIVHNLVSNALKFTEHGEVRVRVGGADAGICIDVEDTGSGIPLEAQAQIFEMFERLESSRAGGVGLGLYIVKNLVQLMGGTVSLASQPGRGSRFTVRLPLAVEAG